MFTPKDMNRLRGSANKATHLARYDVANARRVSTVLDVACPDCKALPNEPCVALRTPRLD